MKNFVTATIIFLGTITLRVICAQENIDYPSLLAQVIKDRDYDNKAATLAGSHITGLFVPQRAARRLFSSKYATERILATGNKALSELSKAMMVPGPAKWPDERRIAASLIAEIGGLQAFSALRTSTRELGAEDFRTHYLLSTLPAFENEAAVTSTLEELRTSQEPNERLFPKLALSNLKFIFSRTDVTPEGIVRTGMRWLDRIGDQEVDVIVKMKNEAVNEFRLRELKLGHNPIMTFEFLRSVASSREIRRAIEAIYTDPQDQQRCGDLMTIVGDWYDSKDHSRRITNESSVAALRKWFNEHADELTWNEQLKRFQIHNP